MPWIVETLDHVVDEELSVLSAELRARFVRIADLIEAVGLERVHEPHVKHIEGRLWQIRLTGANRIARALYVTAPPQRVVVVRVFVKKTEKTTRREIELAMKRAQGVSR